MSRCDDFLPFIHLYLDDEIARPDRDALLAHLEECPRCRALMDDYTRLTGALRTLPEPPPTLHRDMMRHIGRRTAGFWGRRAGKRLMAAAACAALLALVLAGGDRMQLPLRLRDFSLGNQGAGGQTAERAAGGLSDAPPAGAGGGALTVQPQATQAAVASDTIISQFEASDSGAAYSVAQNPAPGRAFAGYLAAVGPGELPPALLEHPSVSPLDGRPPAGLIVAEAGLVPWVAECLAEAGFTVYENPEGADLMPVEPGAAEWLVIIEK